MITPNLDVTIKKPSQDEYSRIYSFSLDLCKKETWYTNSQYASGMVLGTANGTKDFNFPHGSGTGDCLIDVCHGKITEENILVAPTGSYLVSVTVSGVSKNERECFESTGGDFEIDYVGGTIHFFQPQYGEVKATYYYSPSGVGPMFRAAPPSGKIWTIDSAEIQFSEDMVMQDTIVYNVFLNHPIYGVVPAGPNLEYKTFGNFLDFTYGSFPIIPPAGGPQRGTTKNTIIMRWNYLSPIELSSSLEMELRSWTKHGRGFSGERFVIAVYGLESDE